MIQCLVYDTLIDIYPSLSIHLETITILSVMIVTDESDLSLSHATDCTGKLQGELLAFGYYMSVPPFWHSFQK